MEKIGQTATDKQLTLGSLFDGIGGWQLAAIRNGVKPVWSAEIERFPLEVTKVRFPETKQLGDVRNINGAEIEPVDIICAGSPCQNFSQAGNRGGLNGSESSLFGEAIRIIREMREATGGQYPEFFVFENVPGMFSSNKGMDFRAVLEAVTEAEIPMPPGNKWATAGLVECPECEVAWRVLNAEYHGVPQKRKRVFLVGHFRTERRCAGEVLFVDESLPRDPEEKQSQGKTPTTGAEGSFGETDCVNLRMRSGKPGGGKGALLSVEKSLTLAANTNDQVLFDRRPLSFRGGADKEYKTVRRLTELECERCQGLPDYWTLIDHKSCTSTARYKAIGNGMSQPCADFVIRGIVREKTKQKEDE